MTKAESEKTIFENLTRILILSDAMTDTAKALDVLGKYGLYFGEDIDGETVSSFCKIISEYLTTRVDLSCDAEIEVDTECVDE